ncbi:Arv1-like family-domain-containing protein [Rhypophila decipiens]|uniref:Protein ARV n=1 Tax=Rhypophila decipiens TaxID=261697 RepID=A0AAN6YBL0_9PEZI|nr:Arv1-like family-domain-containing protein [Rhypophila decipiens]
MIPTHRNSSTALRPAAQDPDSTSVRSRNRRPAASSGQDADSLLSTPIPSPSRGASPIPATHIGGITGRNNPRTEYASSPSRGKETAAGRGLIDGSWAPSWASVQGFATSIISGSSTLFAADTGGNGSRTRSSRTRTRHSDGPRPGDSWGPEPPSESRPRLDDVAAGSRSQRDARLKAIRTASVLESHEGVNGGLDIRGSFKKRRSDEDLRSSFQGEEEGDHLVYIHHVQPVDTYAGIVLKYRCREDAFRKANGLWSRDNIQTRKWLAVPVDACEVKGKPCNPPGPHSAQIDLLAKTPDTADHFRGNNYSTGDDYFHSSPTGPFEQPNVAEDKPWTHVRWVALDSFTTPVEIGRVPRKALGYFPPRRKKSLLSSRPSTPRGSVEVPSIALSAEAGVDSPRSTSSRRTSLLNNRPQLPNTHTQGPGRSRVGSAGEDARPAWMRRPGGVGSLGKSVRAPGPAKDYFNTWAKKHIPNLAIDSLPSMSVMGAETARLGFGRGAEESAAIVESPFEEGRDVSSPGSQGTGLDKAAAAIETWLRGAFAKTPGTPILGPRGRHTAMEEGDLIELADTNSDDGRPRPLGGGPGDESGLLSSPAYGASGLDGIGTQGVGLAMPICIECRHPVKTLWREGGSSSGRRDNKSSGGHNIRLTVCKNCGRFCDKYVEHDFVVLFIDLVLIKPQVYRHLLHNTLMKDEDEFAPSIVRLGVLLLLFDVYLTWARIEKQSGPTSAPASSVSAIDLAAGSSSSIAGNSTAALMTSNFGRLAQQPIVVQYIFFLLLCTLSTLAFHFSIRFLTSSRFSPLSFFGTLPQYSRPNSVSTALLVSSSTKLFPILMVIWEYDVPAAARSLGWAVVANNVEALKILLDCGYGVAAVLATAGALSRWAMGRVVLWVAGLEGVDSAGEHSVAEDGRALGALLMNVLDWAGRLAVG